MEESLSADLRRAWLDRFGQSRVICHGRCFPSASLREYKGRYIGKLVDDSLTGTESVASPLWYPKRLHDELVKHSYASLTLRGSFVLGRSNRKIGIEVRFELTDILAVTSSESVRLKKEKIDVVERVLTARCQCRQNGLSFSSMIEKKMETYRETGRKVRVVCLIPVSSHILDDVMASLSHAKEAFEIHEERVNMADPVRVAAVIRQVGKETDRDFLCVVRGGGKELIDEVFNDPAVLEALSESLLPVVAAIGHHDDMTLFDKYADESFHTPSALGAWLNDKWKSVSVRPAGRLVAEEDKGGVGDENRPIGEKGLLKVLVTDCRLLSIEPLVRLPVASRNLLGIMV